MELYKDEQDRRNKQKKFLCTFWASQQLIVSKSLEVYEADTSIWTSRVCFYGRGNGCHLEQHAINSQLYYYGVHDCYSWLNVAQANQKHASVTSLINVRTYLHPTYSSLLPLPILY